MKKRTSKGIYKDAVNLVRNHQIASASFLQRHLRISWDLASELVQRMESEKIIGPAQGSLPRKVFINRDEGHDASQND